VEVGRRRGAAAAAGRPWLVAKTALLLGEKKRKEKPS
jgi:hypothetical protein